ncbi:MAG: hypothetical protein VB127_12100 [Sphaerochaeta sp.]|nr:hypothetical protein [Sphaerochaeta sp.]
MFGKKKVGFRQISEKELQDVTSHVAEKEILSLKEQVSSKNQKIEALCKEIEQFYLEAIDNAETVDEVKAILSMYHESELSKVNWRSESWGRWCIKVDNGIKFAQEPSAIIKAAATKTKELNREWINEVCDQLDNYQIGEDEVSYADHMMELLKVIANIEADGKAILDAWKSGLDAWRVFLSMLSVYGVKRADVLGAE